MRRSLLFAPLKFRQSPEKPPEANVVVEPRLTPADRNKIVHCRPKPAFYAGHFGSLIMHEVIYFLKAPSYRLVQNFLVVLAVSSVLL